MGENSIGVPTKVTINLSEQGENALINFEMPAGFQAEWPATRAARLIFKLLAGHFNKAPNMQEAMKDLLCNPGKVTAVQLRATMDSDEDLG